MNIEEEVQALLVAALPAYGSPAVELVPAARIKVPGDWQSLARPYVIHGPVAVSPIELHSGRAALTQWPSYQVSCFGDSWSSARVVANAVVATLAGNHDGAQFFWRGMTPLFESDPPVHHIALEFEVWEAL